MPIIMDTGEIIDDSGLQSLASEIFENIGNDLDEYYLDFTGKTDEITIQRRVANENGGQWDTPVLSLPFDRTYDAIRFVTALNLLSSLSVGAQLKLLETTGERVNRHDEQLRSAKTAPYWRPHVIVITQKKEHEEDFQFAGWFDGSVTWNGAVIFEGRGNVAHLLRTAVKLVLGIPVPKTSWKSIKESLEDQGLILQDGFKQSFKRVGNHYQHVHTYHILKRGAPEALPEIAIPAISGIPDMPEIPNISETLEIPEIPETTAVTVVAEAADNIPEIHIEPSEPDPAPEPEPEPTKMKWKKKTPPVVNYRVAGPDDFAVGQSVSHILFGTGTVTELKQRKVFVEFERYKGRIVDFPLSGAHSATQDIRIIDTLSE